MLDAAPNVAPIPRANILGVGVSAINMDMAVAAIDGWIRAGTPQYVCVTPVHSIMECYDDPEVRAIYNRAGLVTPDGMPVVWLAQRLGYPHVRRVYGPDLMLAVCAHAAAQGYRHYFYGGAEGVAAELARILQTRFPGLAVAGALSPPFRALSPEEDEAISAQIRDARPHIVWVGLGAPKQERWMAAHVGKVGAPVLIGVGAAFDFLTGRKPQAPRWMQRSGLEWLFRLASEPRRLFRRYLSANSRFIVLTALQLSGLRRFPIQDVPPAS